MKAITSRASLFAVSMLALAACGGAGSTEGQQTSGSPDTAALTEMSMGADDAPVTVIEYASWTCPACLQFQNDVVGQFKDEYVETGKVKFVFREFPTPPARLSIAGFAVARCAGEDKYFDVLDELFSRQTAILTLAREGGQVTEALQQIAANHGITDKAEFDSCLNDADIRKAIAASVAAGETDGVNATPTVLLNGEPLPGYDWRRWDGMKAVLDEALGEDAPAADTAATPAPTAEDMPAEDSEGESDNSDAVETDSGETTPE
ncbi:DsbA family protein [Henriciella sp. AS95]|uniref:DsbA family protein n=1 Tax=Henriciella sp. AS95 TaxID=3135782 RepID=UPI003174171B